VAEGRRADEAKGLVEQIQRKYLADVAQHRAEQARHTEQALTAKRERHEALRRDYEEFLEKFKSFAGQEAPQGHLDEAVLAVAGRMSKSLGDARQRVDKLGLLRDKMFQTQAEIQSPSAKVDPGKLRQAEEADLRFSLDYKALRVRHQKYVAAFDEDFTAADEALRGVRKHLRKLTETLGKQLLLKLPDDLADDLTELNLATGLYDGQLASYQERWEQYRRTVLGMLERPERADYDGIQTLLSSLRQDLVQRSGELPKRLGGLFDRLRSGPKADAGKTGTLAMMTVRHVASTAVEYDLEQVLAAWRELTIHINRLFPEDNVQLRTLAYSCRNLQGRLVEREQDIRSRLEKETLAAARQAARLRLEQLQTEFHQAGVEAAALYEGLLTDQKKLCDLVERWPKWRELALDKEKRLSELAASARALEQAGVEYWPEELEAGPVVAVRSGRLAALAGWETPMSAIVALAAGFGMWSAAFGRRRPEP